MAVQLNLSIFHKKQFGYYKKRLQTRRFGSDGLPLPKKSLFCFAIWLGEERRGLFLSFFWFCRTLVAFPSVRRLDRQSEQKVNRLWHIASRERVVVTRKSVISSIYMIALSHHATLELNLARAKISRKDNFARENF